MYTDEILEYFETFEPFIYLFANISFGDTHVVIHEGKEIFFYSKSD